MNPARLTNETSDGVLGCGVGTGKKSIINRPNLTKNGDEN